MISASAVSSIALTYATGGSWSTFTSTNLATAGNLQQNWIDITSQIGNGYVTAINSCISEVTGLRSTSSIIYYVNATAGDDSNAGTSAGTAFASIQTAINKLPDSLNHSATINIASGTYAETISAAGLIGIGTLLIQGGSSYSNAANYVISFCDISNNIILVVVKGLKASSTGTYGFGATRSQETQFYDCDAQATATGNMGFYCSHGGFAYISSCYADNKGYGIYSNLGTIVHSNTNSGSNNIYGIAAVAVATLGKNSSQPSGTTANEFTNTGGEIR